MTASPQILGPVPRRTFQIGPASTQATSSPSTPETLNSELLETKLRSASPPRKNKSILNLTSSTLLGIYSPTTYDPSRAEPFSAADSAIELPRQTLNPQTSRSPIDAEQRNAYWSPSSSHDGHQTLLKCLLSSPLLFVVGGAYGAVISHLHDHQRFGPIGAGALHLRPWVHVSFWGSMAALLGSLQPWVDLWCSSAIATAKGGTKRPYAETSWTLVVRSTGAFVGIAFAIRKLPWQSTLQASLTFALANLVLWYLIDRTRAGFLLSATVGFVGTLALLEISPGIVPPPTIRFPTQESTNESSINRNHHAVFSQESCGNWLWVASVLYCSSMCFGNLGRRLALRLKSDVA